MVNWDVFAVSGIDKTNWEWQQTGENEWRFGEKIRGLVRYPKGEVYFDEERKEREGGWIWFVIIDDETKRQDVAAKLEFAVEEVEKVLLGEST